MARFGSTKPNGRIVLADRREDSSFWRALHRRLSPEDQRACTLEQLRQACGFPFLRWRRNLQRGSGVYPTLSVRWLGDFKPRLARVESQARHMASRVARGLDSYRDELARSEETARVLRAEREAWNAARAAKREAAIHGQDHEG